MLHRYQIVKRHNYTKEVLLTNIIFQCREANGIDQTDEDARAFAKQLETFYNDDCTYEIVLES